MDLSTILKKTEKKNTSIKRNTSSNVSKINIANKDRPYDLKEIQKSNSKKNTTVNDTKPIIQGKPSESKVSTNSLQSNNKSSNKEPTKEQQSVYKTSNKVSTNELQSDYKKISSNGNTLSINKISGIQKTILDHLFFECQKSGSRITKEISINALINELSTTKKNIKTSIYRLEKKNYISRQDFKNGRGGWTKYEIPEIVYSELFKYQELNKNNFQDEKVTTKSNTSSSSINTTTNLPEDWKNINFESLKDYGFNEKHILQISKLDAVTPEELQNSINHFVFDLQENGKEKEIKKSPLAFFMGIIRGQGIYVAPKNYESLQDRKLRLKVEQEKQSKERREKLEKELINIEYDEWRAKLTDSEAEELIPEHIKNAKYLAEPQKLEFLRTYFVKNFWDTIKQEKHADCFDKIKKESR
jgi:uncharacterized protein with NAD-binding domain and iron-sulfur cluster